MILIQAAWLNSSPHADSHGRPIKVGREEMVMTWLTAEKSCRLDFDAIDRECVKQTEYIERELSGGAGSPAAADAGRSHPQNQARHGAVGRGRTGNHRTETDEQLMAGPPRIAVSRLQPQGIELTVFINDPGDEKVVVRRLKQLLKA